jgi:hypothetical protein
MAAGTEDQEFFKKASEDLADYLASPVLFWPLKTDSQPLTIGNLLLTQRKVAAMNANEYPGELKSASRLVDKARAERPVAWHKKAEAELHARINQYKTLVEELDKGGYEVVARLRAIIEILLSEVLENENQHFSIDALDSQLRRWIEPGDFLWAESIAPSFPRDQFWFLYAKPRG